MPKISFFSPRGDTLIDPDMEMLEDLMLNKSDDFWNVQACQASLTYHQGSSKMKLILNMEKAHGFCFLFVSKDGHYVVVHIDDFSHVVTIWSICLLTHWPGLPRALALSPDGKTLAIGGATRNDSGQIELWNLATRQLEQTLTGAPAPAFALAYTPDGKTLFASHARFGWAPDGEARLWNVATEKTRAILKGDSNHLGAVPSVAVSPDGKLLATGGFNAFAKIWDAETAKEKVTLSGHTGIIQSLTVLRP